MSAPDAVVVDGLEDLDGVELIQHIPLFARLDFDDTTRLRRVMTLERHPAGHRLIEQDSLGQALYIIRAGRVAVSRHDEAGADVPLGEVGPGEVVGEMALLDDLLTAATVVCVTDCEVLAIPRAPFEDLLASDAALALVIYRSFSRTLCDRLRKANLLIAEGGVR